MRNAPETNWEPYVQVSEEGKFYVVKHVPTGVVTQGETHVEALEMLTDVVALEMDVPSPVDETNDSETEHKTMRDVMDRWMTDE